MATTVINPTIAKGGVGGLSTAPVTVYTKSIQITVPTGGPGSGYYTGDTLNIKNVHPIGTEIIGAWYKVSATQGSTLTFALTAGANAGAFVAAQNLTATGITKMTVVPGTAGANSINTADNDLNVVLAGTTVGTTAATITFTFQYAVIDPATSVYSTYTL